MKKKPTVAFYVCLFFVGSDCRFLINEGRVKKDRGRALIAREAEIKSELNLYLMQ